MTDQMVEPSKHRQGHDREQKDAEPHIQSVVICGLWNKIKHHGTHGRDEQADHQQLTAVEQTARQQVTPLQPPSLCHVQVNSINVMVNCPVWRRLNS
jgi:hypothetical protein